MTATQDTDHDRIIRIPEVAQITGFSQNTLRAWRQSKKVGPPSYKLASTVVYKEREVREWLDAQLATAEGA